METLELSNNTLPIISVAAYGTRLEPESWAENYYDRLSCDDESYTDEKIRNMREHERFDSDKWDKEVIRLSECIIRDLWLPMMQQYGVKDITQLSIHHPRYYNFENDELYFTLVLEEDWKEKILARFKEAWENSEEVRKFAADNYTSYDGFTSFTSNNYEDLSKMETVQDMAAVITLVTLYDGYDFEQAYDTLYEDMWEQMDYGDYVTYEDEEGES